MKRRMLAVAVAGFLVCGCRAIWAADAGDPVFPVDLNNQARAEIVYENLQRDFEMTSGPLDGKDTLKADVFLLRVHTDVGQYAYLDFDAGAMDPSGGDFRFYGGVGLRYLAYDSKAWRLSAFAQGHYVPGAETEFNGDGNTKAKLDFNLVEADAGVLATVKIPAGNQLTILPYIGPMLSILRLSGDAKDEATGAKDDFHANEDSIFGGVLGVSLLLPGNHTIRLEGRYTDAFSVSAAAGIAF